MSFIGGWPDRGFPSYGWADYAWPTYGVATPATAPTHTEVTYAQFDTIGTFKVRQWEKDDTTFSMKLEEPKARLKKKVPVALFTIDSYPSIPQDSIGEPIPIAYGYVYDAPAICINATTPQFIVAGHEITGFDAVRVLEPDTEQWNAVSFLTTTEADGTFTLNASDWDGNAPVAVDFRGKPTSAGSGVLMTNAADVMYDFLNVECGIPAAQLDLAGTFAASDAKVVIGTGQLAQEINHRALSLYINELEQATDIIELINRTVGSYLYPDAYGVYQYVIFEPEPGAGSTLFDETNIFSFQEDTETKEKVSQVRGQYRNRKAIDTTDSAVHPDAKYQYLAGEPVAITDEVEFAVYEERDANYVTQREVRMRGGGQKIYKMKVSHEGFLVNPGDFIKVEYSRFGINDIFEVLERRVSLPGMTVELKVGDLHGMRDETGFWVADSPVFPDSLGGASTATWSAGWSDAQKDWARQNLGYWLGDTNFAVDTDGDSYLASVWY